MGTNEGLLPYLWQLVQLETKVKVVAFALALTFFCTHLLGLNLNGEKEEEETTDGVW